MVRVENQLELAYVSQTNISLACTSESFPPAIHYWKFRNGSALIRGMFHLNKLKEKYIDIKDIIWFLFYIYI